MADSREYHRQSEPIRRFDDVRVTHRAPWLDDGCGARFRNFFYPIRKRKERVGGRDCALSGEYGLHGADAAGIDAAHLSGADAYALPVARVNNGVGLNVLGDLPGEEQGTHFFGRGLTF